VKAENAFTIAEAHSPVHLAPVAVIAPLAALAWVAVSGPAGELVVEGVVQDLEIALGDAVLVVVGPALDHRIEGVDETCLRRTAMVLDDVPQLAVDRALGVGGVPRSRVTEIFGPEGGGKTTLAQHIVAEAQKLGGTAVYIDMEHAVDLAYMQACGVDTSAVYFSQPDSGTDALNIVRKLVSSNTVDLIVVDSVAALTSVAELDADAGDQFMGVQARMMSQNLKTIVPSLGLSKTALVFINQTRTKIGVMYGNPETTPGGVALRFYSSVRMRVARKGTLGSREAFCTPSTG
jgi:recombination protein RecA